VVRAVKDATVRAYHYETREALAAHVQAFVTAYNVGKHLKRLRRRTPLQGVCDHRAADPAPFRVNPHHLIPGPYKWRARGPPEPLRLTSPPARAPAAPGTRDGVRRGGVRRGGVRRGGGRHGSSRSNWRRTTP
jgi:hypothetical protein